ncbi:hypothetical protein Pr1d_40440 [Bythopirellula goksoeyrii]|uniref:Retropepsin-like aspartic endopeptidase domain-containing protein n=1 Tax=Bythopirellula goksoeyrii TaxID=1400387 RepID=A0A5B9QCL1_9BACT|nr:hypothetical protein Pr1d_40440 [Bythopirellula goksoeyrii]
MILLVGVMVPAGSLGTAKESAEPANASTKKAESNNGGSELTLKRTKKSKLATNLLASATKTRKSRKTAPSSNVEPITKSDLKRAKLDLVEESDLPNLEPRNREDEKLTIGAIARVTETQSELPFLARVDTGAASCSMHCEEWEIDEEAESMEENIGKDIRVLISNDENESQWVDSRIEHCVVVKTSEKRETRYKVPMTLRWKDFEKEVVVTLNNRGHMVYPLLLGRNFLENDFVVDITLPSE